MAANPIANARLVKKDQFNFGMLVQHYSVSLLDAPTLAQRETVADEIAGDPDLSAAILMLLSEQIFPVIADQPQEGQQQ